MERKKVVEMLNINKHLWIHRAAWVFFSVYIEVNITWVISTSLKILDFPVHGFMLREA